MSEKNETTSSFSPPLDYAAFGRSVTEASGNDAACKLAAGLYVVATPIGNLGDISLRALATLARADVIACEDTRTSGVLLSAFGIKRPTLSCHDHNEDDRAQDIVQRIQGGQAIALISDAGLPAISDPGFRLARACRDQGLPVIVVPGANAALTALAGGGLPTDRFFFAGFLPAKASARQNDIAALRIVRATLVFYESPQRLAACLADLCTVLGADRPAVVARELTKFYEESRRGTLRELTEHYAAHEARGEIVLLVGGNSDEEAQDIDALLRDSLKRLSLRDAVAEVAAITGGKKKDIYNRALEIEKA